MKPVHTRVEMKPVHTRVEMKPIHTTWAVKPVHTKWAMKPVHTREAVKPGQATTQSSVINPCSHYTEKVHTTETEKVHTTEAENVHTTETETLQKQGMFTLQKQRSDRWRCPPRFLSRHLASNTHVTPSPPNEGMKGFRLLTTLVGPFSCLLYTSDAADES